MIGSLDMMDALWSLEQVFGGLETRISYQIQANRRSSKIIGKKEKEKEKESNYRKLSKKNFFKGGMENG